MSDTQKQEITIDRAAAKYLEFRREVEAIEKDMKAKTAAIKQKMADLESWITAKAIEQGMETIKVHDIGTVYWSTHYSATVASRDVLFDFVREHNAFELLENRVSKTAVKEYLEAHGEVPPGVNFSSVKVFNLRQAKAGE